MNFTYKKVKLSRFSISINKYNAFFKHNNNVTYALSTLLYTFFLLFILKLIFFPLPINKMQKTYVMQIKILSIQYFNLIKNRLRNSELMTKKHFFPKITAIFPPCFYFILKRMKKSIATESFMTFITLQMAQAVIQSYQYIMVCS